MTTKIMTPYQFLLRLEQSLKNDQKVFIEEMKNDQKDSKTELKAFQKDNNSSLFLQLITTAMVCGAVIIGGGSWLGFYVYNSYFPPISTQK